MGPQSNVQDALPEGDDASLGRAGQSPGSLSTTDYLAAEGDASQRPTPPSDDDHQAGKIDLGEPKEGGNRRGRRRGGTPEDLARTGEPDSRSRPLPPSRDEDQPAEANVGESAAERKPVKESRVAPQRPDYEAAKTGDIEAADRMVRRLMHAEGIAAGGRIIGDRPVVFVPVEAFESAGPNVIPTAMVELLAERLSGTVDEAIRRTNVVSHTRADGFHWIANPAQFGGEAEASARYVLVDDLVGMEGTLASLKGHTERNGGTVVGAVT